MTILVPDLAASAFTTVSASREGMIFGAMKPTGWDPAVDTNGHTVLPGGAPRFSTARAASGTATEFCYIVHRAFTLTEIAVRHRVAGGVATVITYQVWRNSAPVATFAAAVAANSVVEVVDAAPSPINCVLGDRLEVVAQVAATIADADMPEDIAVYLF